MDLVDFADNLSLRRPECQKVSNKDSGTVSVFGGRASPRAEIRYFSFGFRLAGTLAPPPMAGFEAGLPVAIQCANLAV
jgi:hypothetical protein